MTTGRAWTKECSAPCRGILNPNLLHNPFGGEGHRHRRARIELALQVERAAMQFDERLGKRQAETGSLIFAA